MQHALAAMLLVLLIVPGAPSRSDDSLPNLVLVTLDGVRWQEVFGGIDLSLVEDERFTDAPDKMKNAFWHEQREERRKKTQHWTIINMA